MPQASFDFDRPREGPPGGNGHALASVQELSLREVPPPPIKFCPFCGSDRIKFVQTVPRCMACRHVFILAATRKVRAARSSAAPGTHVTGS